MAKFWQCGRDGQIPGKIHLNKDDKRRNSKLG